jgi:hypothetical protein
MKEETSSVVREARRRIRYGSYAVLALLATVSCTAPPRGPIDAGTLSDVPTSEDGTPSASGMIPCLVGLARIGAIFGQTAGEKPARSSQ